MCYNKFKHTDSDKQVRTMKNSELSRVPTIVQLKTIYLSFRCYIKLCIKTLYKYTICREKVQKFEKKNEAKTENPVSRERSELSRGGEDHCYIWPTLNTYT